MSGSRVERRDDRKMSKDRAEALLQSRDADASFLETGLKSIR